MNFEVLNKEFVFEHPLRKSTKHRASWEFTGDESLIERITTSCGCTNGHAEGNEIIAFYNAPDRTTEVLQKVVVWLKDGKPFETINPVNGQKMRNHDKAHIELSLKGTVI